jgi:hypothetical protein
MSRSVKAVSNMSRSVKDDYFENLDTNTNMATKQRGSVFGTLVVKPGKILPGMVLFSDPTHLADL